jgi:UDP-3-O-[3-hydroxymyristoyl] glucosamine N-acyltransferase
MILVSDPLQAMIQATALLTRPQPVTSGIDPSAQIHSSVQLGEGVSIGAYTVIEEGVRIGKNSMIANNVVIHAGSRLGANTVINSGCIVGASPFNYLKEHGVWKQGLVVGGVILADGVHLGANTVIDRGTLSDTYLATGVCVDNLVQIAHDAQIGKNTVIAGCTAIGAYAQIGADCIIGGASSIAAHAQLADDIVITGMSTVNKSISKPGIYSSGTLVHEHQQWRRNAARFRRLDDYIMKLNTLEKKISSTEN